MTKKYKSLEGIQWKIEDGGLGYAIENYFGRDLHSVSSELNQAWETAYDALLFIHEILKDKDCILGDGMPSDN